MMRDYEGRRKKKRKEMKDENDSQLNSENSSSIVSRFLWWHTRNNRHDNSPSFESNIGDDFDSWAQAWRYLGAYVDCSTANGYGNRRGLAENENYDACQRYIIWGGYVNEHYGGGGVQEYKSSNVRKRAESLNCHEQGTGWKLMGLYRIDVENFIEQMAKHLWAYNTKEYQIFYTILNLVNGGKCTSSGIYSSNSKSRRQLIYYAISPSSKGYLEMGLYTDGQCLYRKEKDLGMTWDDLDLFTEDDDTMSSYWPKNEKYKLLTFNEILQKYSECSLCLDYPSYQDGELNGDGYDGDDLISQCWKFYSHGTYPCTESCISIAATQGGLVPFMYGGKLIGGASDRNRSDSKASKYLAFSLFIFAINSILFAAYINKRRREESSKNAHSRYTLWPGSSSKRGMQKRHDAMNKVTS